MLFFKTNDLALTNSARPNTVYRRKEHGYAAFVCAVSRPKPQSFIDTHGGIKTTCVISSSDGVVNKFDSFVNNSNTTENIHSKKDFNSVVVMYKTASTSNTNIQFLPMAKFLEMYELVIGYNERGEMLTNSMIEAINTSGK